MFYRKVAPTNSCKVLYYNGRRLPECTALSISDDVNVGTNLEAVLKAKHMQCDKVLFPGGALTTLAIQPKTCFVISIILKGIH